MIEKKYVGEFSFHNVIYLALGCALFMGPWMLINAFWDVIGKLPIVNIIMANIFAIGMNLAFFTYLVVEKNKLGPALKKAFRKLVFNYVVIFIVSCAMLVIYGKISLMDPLSFFSRNIVAGMFANIVAGTSFDLLMSK